MSDLTARLVEYLKSLDMQALKTEIENLEAVREWALASLDLDYRPGDRVKIVHPRPSQRGDGWACYSEALAVGQTGIAGEITFDTYSNGWFLLVGMDRCWSTHERAGGQVTRFWYGPSDEMPDGFELGHHPDGQVQHFYMRVSWVAKAD